VGVANGLDALYLSLRALDIGPGDEVIVPSNTYIATAIAVTMVGATVVFAEPDAATYNMDVRTVAAAITPRTRAIMPVHLSGQCADMGPINTIAQDNGLYVIEDAAQSFGAEYQGKRCGGLGDIASFSFYPSKNLGAFGDGGMLVTREDLVAQTMRSLRNYGSLHKYYHTDYGTNSRLDTIQAAVLSTKLPCLSGWNSDRYHIAQQYDRLLEPLQPAGITPIVNHSGNGHVYHLYVIRVAQSCRLDRNQLQEQLGMQGIQTGIHYPIACHLQPAFIDLGYRLGDFPHAETLCQEILSLPMYPGLSLAQIQRVVMAIAALVNPSASLDLQLCSASVSGIH